MKTRGFKKSIALIVIAAFIWQLNIFLYPQVEVVIVKQFQRAKNCYLNEQYDDARMRSERVIDIINEKKIDRKDILGMCYLLLGAIAEKGNNPLPAAGHYRKAREVYGITLVDGVDLDELPLYRELVKGEIPPGKGKIEVETVKKKKKFPWLLAAAGAVVVGILVYFIFLKPQKKYQLAVTRGEGVQGLPQSNIYRYKKGARVDYNYSAAVGYANPVVTLDGNAVPSSGTITMNGNHILTAFSSLNTVTFVTDTEKIEIPEDQSITFKVKLSAQPQANVNVMVSRIGGDTDIQVITHQLDFTTTNWDIYQPIILQAIEDTDDADNEATIRLNTKGTTNIADKDLIAREQDNDHPTIAITEPQGNSTLNGQIWITAEAAAATTIARVEFYIDWEKKKTDIKVPYNYFWNTVNAANGLHVIKVVAYDIDNKASSREISVNVLNGPIQYTLTVYKEEGIDGSPLTGNVHYAQGEIISYNYTLQSGHSNLIVLLDNKEIAPSGTLNMDRDHELRALADPSLYTLNVERKTGVSGTPESGIKKYKGDETVSYHYTLQDDFFDLIVKLDGVTVANPGSISISNENHNLVAEAKIGFKTDTDQVVICEGKTKTFGVKLSAPPENPVTAAVRWVNNVDNDRDIQVTAGESLTFGLSNWNVYQYVTLRAAEDTDTYDGQASISIEATGLYTHNIVAKEHDSTADPRPQISISGVSEGQVISNTVVISTAVSDDDGINKVELYIDGILKGSSPNAIFKYEWNVAGAAVGEHKIKIIAYDLCNQPGEKEITVFINSIL